MRITLLLSTLLIAVSGVAGEPTKEELELAVIQRFEGVQTPIHVIFGRVLDSLRADATQDHDTAVGVVDFQLNWVPTAPGSDAKTLPAPEHIVFSREVAEQVTNQLLKLQSSHTQEHKLMERELLCPGGQPSNSTLIQIYH